MHAPLALAATHAPAPLSSTPPPSAQDGDGCGAYAARGYDCAAPGYEAACWACCAACRLASRCQPLLKGPALRHETLRFRSPEAAPLRRAPPREGTP